MRDLLRSLRWLPAAPGATPPAVRDVVLTGVVCAAAATEAAFRTGLADRWWALAVALLAAVLLPWRRVAPAGVLGVVVLFSGGTALVLGHEHGLVSLVVVLLLPYALYRWGSSRAIVAGTAWVLLHLGVVGWVGNRGDGVAGLLIVGLLAAVGVVVRQRAAARARGLEQVRSLERERLARDLHDTVAHHVSAIAVRAQAGLAQASPEASGEALRLIAAEASATLAEMRGLVHVLRDDAAPAVTDLLRLAAPAEGPHPAVVVELGDGLDDVPSDAAAALFRVAQESVTNARRHAAAASEVRVRLHADGGDLRLAVDDDGDPVLGRAGSEGFGLRGMRERVEALGGSFAAGPGPVRGWSVAATVPAGGGA